MANSRIPRSKNALGLGAALCVAGALVLGGCASAPVADWSIPEITGPPTEFDGQLPFDSYELTREELGEMERAQAVLLSRCAQEYGVEASYLGDFTRPPGDPRLIWGGLLGLMDESHAAEFGYHPAPNGDWAPVGGFYLRDPSNIFPSLAEGASDETALAVGLVTYGPDFTDEATSVPVPVDANGVAVPTGGCMGIVDAEINAPLVSLLDIKAEVYNLTLDHPQVVDAISRWSDCMARAGYDFTEVQAPGRSFTLATQTVEEVETALADVECTMSSNWADLFYAVLTDYEEQAIARDPQLFNAAINSQIERQRALDGITL